MPEKTPLVYFTAYGNDLYGWYAGPDEAQREDAIDRWAMACIVAIGSNVETVEGFLHLDTWGQMREAARLARVNIHEFGFPV
ncbi:hypothetical protein [Acrocarpospora sp. B8E8]|uniref:hypothetical protein n=1 Tax=Acrocarpospora sp. B8E8 TaxID=3153572 RepID=UPI00325D0EBD